MAIYANLTIDQGSTFGAEVAIEDSTHTLFNLTGYTASGQIRKTPQSTTVAATFSCSIPDPLSGTVYISLSDEVTSGIKAGRYMYDIYIEDDSGNRFRAIEGLVTVTPAITR